MQENIHSEHRKRVRKAFLQDGFSEGTPPHKILEMLLFYSIPRKDTNELAHVLLNRFGSVSGVLDATPEELMKVDGVGENTAALLKLVIPMTKLYMDEKSSQREQYRSVNKICDFLANKYIGYTKEVFAVTTFNSRGEILGFDVLGTGDIASVGVSVREVIEVVLKRKAIYVIISHNHPGGIAMPSDADVELTRNISEALKHIEVRLLDHIVICDDDYVSMKQSKYYEDIFE